MSLLRKVRYKIKPKIGLQKFQNVNLLKLHLDKTLSNKYFRMIIKILKNNKINFDGQLGLKCILCCFVYDYRKNKCVQLTIFLARKLNFTHLR